MLADILAGQLSVYSWVSIYAEKWIILGKIIFGKSLILLGDLHLAVNWALWNLAESSFPGGWILNRIALFQKWQSLGIE